MEVHANFDTGCISDFDHVCLQEVVKRKENRPSQQHKNDVHLKKMLLPSGTAVWFTRPGGKDPCPIDYYSLVYLKQMSQRTSKGTRSHRSYNDGFKSPYFKTACATLPPPPPLSCGPAQIAGPCLILIFCKAMNRLSNQWWERVISNYTVEPFSKCYLALMTKLLNICRYFRHISCLRQEPFAALFWKHYYTI